MSNARTLVIFMLTLVLAAGCQTAPTGPATEDLEATRVARGHLRAGEYLPAAQEYLRLAEGAAGATALAYRLDAASAFVLAHRPEAARQILDAVGGQSLSRDLQVRRSLVEAQLALAEERPADALALLGAAPAEGASPELLARYHTARADALEATGEHIASAGERVQLELLVTETATLNENRRRIWESLSGLPPKDLEAAHIPPPSTLGGWIELAAIGKSTITDPEALGQAIALWRHRYPGHPAGESIVPMLIDDSYIAWSPARTVALLLPFEGQFGTAAAAVRDGFMAAWFADADLDTRPEVLIRDTSGGDVRGIYDRSIDEGADFVVGPLTRTAVTQLATSGPLPVPTLVLNRADDGSGAVGAPEPEAVPTTKSGLYRFALLPESEARLVAEYAWFAGHTKAAVLAPAGAWGERVAGAFADEWQHLGGTVVEMQSYPSDGSDMSGPVRRVLNVDESDARYRSLRQILGTDLKQEARRRRDVDFVFMAAFPLQARQLRPQLEFHQAQDLPVYSTSHVFTGIADAEADRDIDGVIFGDMPWVLDPEGSAGDLRRNVGALWADTFRAHVRLFAFGADAYRLVKELGRLRAQKYAELRGVTGSLSLNERNQIDRRLMWARFRRGTPRIIESGLDQIQ